MRTLSTAIRWLARLLGLVMVVVLILYMNSEGLWNVNRLSGGELLLLGGLVLMIMGALAAWKWEVAGALMVLAGFALFWYAGEQFPGGRYSLMPLAGTLHLIAWMLDHKPAPAAATSAGRTASGRENKRAKRVS